MLKVSISVTGDKELIRKLKNVGQDFQDWTPELKTVADMLVPYFTNSVFETEGGIFGMRWIDLTPSYESWKRSMFPGRGILQRGGGSSENMRGSFATEVSPLSVIVANTASYAKYHDSDEPRRVIPKRKLIHIDDSLKNKVVDIFKESIVVKLRKGLT